MRWVTIQSEVLKDSESVIPINIPSSNYLLVGKVVAETREPEGSDRKILEEKQQRKVERKKPCLFHTIVLHCPIPKNEDEKLCAFTSPSFNASPCLQDTGLAYP